MLAQRFAATSLMILMVGYGLSLVIDQTTRPAMMQNNISASAMLDCQMERAVCVNAFNR